MARQVPFISTSGERLLTKEEIGFLKDKSTGSTKYKTYGRLFAHLKGEWRDWKRRHHWDFGSVEDDESGIGIDSYGRLFIKSWAATALESYIDDMRAENRLMHGDDRAP